MESRNGGKVRHIVLTRHQVNMGSTLPRCRYGIFEFGRACIHVLRTILVGSIVPVIKAASKEEPPPRPPKMKYQDLPIYASPHNDYKEYLLKKNNYCPGANVKILHTALLPYVKKLRESSRDVYCDICCGFRGTYKDVRESIVSAKNESKKTMRDPANLQIRQGVMASGTMLGFLMGGGGGIPRRAIYTSLGALAAGSLCFPKETDEVFREATYHAAKTLLAFYNGMCNKKYELRERVPCKDGLPAEPKPKKPICPPKK